MELAQSIARVIRVYRMHWTIRGFAAAFVAFCALGLMGFWSRLVTRPGTHLAAMVEWARWVSFALGWAIYVFGSSIVLLDNALEKRTPLGTRDCVSMRFVDGVMWFTGTTTGSYIRYLTLIRKDSYLPSIRFQKFYEFDSTFYEWYNLSS